MLSCVSCAGLGADALAPYFVTLLHCKGVILCATQLHNPEHPASDEGQVASRMVADVDACRFDEPIDWQSALAGTLSR